MNPQISGHFPFKICLAPKRKSLSCEGEGASHVKLICLDLLSLFLHLSRCSHLLLTGCSAMELFQPS